MNMLDAILNAQSGGAARQIGQTVGLDQNQAETALSALIPALAAGFERNLRGSGGIEALTAALAGGNHGRYLDNPSILGDPSSIADGNGILSHVFGSKDVSRHVAARAATQTGINPDILKRMLPIAAGLMMAYMARQRQRAPAATTAAAAGPDFASMLGPLMGSSSGSIVDAVTGMPGGGVGRSRSSPPERQGGHMALREKYNHAIQTAKSLKMDGSADERDGKLYFKGTVKSQDEANKIWDAIKTVPDWSREVVADIKAVGVPVGATAAPAAARTYTVKAGDTLSKIAKEFLGDANKYTAIFNANRDQLSDPDKIKPGQVLKLP